MKKITEKQKCIAEQAVYGDLWGIDFADSYKELQSIVGYQGKLIYIGCTLNDIDKIKLFLRPMSDLCKEITHKGYNDDKPFVPLVEIAKLFGINNGSIDEDNNQLVGYSSSCGEDYDDGYFGHEEGWFWYFGISLQGEYYPCYPCEFKKQVSDLLNLLHFDTRNIIEKGEAVDVNTLSNNPYTV